MSMKQELGILEQNINFFVKSFEASCKLTSKMSCSELIKTVDEHIMRRTLCKDIQRHLQLWKLSDVVMKNDHYVVVLSYCDILFQRETNLLMGTLIDVLEEILLSRLELWNLASSTFWMQSSGELQLQLCFYSSGGGRKLVLGLDMTNLKCGVYPASPTELKIQVEKQQTTFPASTVNEAIRAVRVLEGGPLFILRLCRSISQFLQSSAVVDI
ncbi:hypothetical protein KSP39_PZI023982 [Platanthera zijinensis]|uniref:Uncharacterized protein n=1 Tax=Platanthera zijinensis TaxID=2320716 RepID=A0AAP0ATZ3_9ASPA